MNLLDTDEEEYLYTDNKKNQTKTNLQSAQEKSVI